MDYFAAWEQEVEAEALQHVERDAEVDSAYVDVENGDAEVGVTKVIEFCVVGTLEHRQRDRRPFGVRKMEK